MKRQRHTPEQIIRKLREAERLLGDGKTSLLTQPVMRATVPPPRPLDRERPQLSAQRRIVLGPLGLVPLGRAVLPAHSACPALADAEAVAKHRDRLSPTGRAHQFPRATSFNARFSSAWSATIAFN